MSMFEKPSIFKVPTISSNSNRKEACLIYNVSCTGNYSTTCGDSYSSGSNGATDIVGDAIGVALTAVGSIASVSRLT